jgi:hypothetical protein
MNERGSHHAPASAIERIYAQWDEALGAKDTESAMALYHPDATLESPLVCHLLGTGEGVVRGREAPRLPAPASAAPPVPRSPAHRRKPGHLGVPAA